MKNKILTLLLICSSLLSLNAQIKLDSLLAYYPFNGNAGDSSGSGAHATAFNTIDTLNRFGDTAQAFYFNGTSGYVLLPNDSALKPSFPFSISLWLYIDDYPQFHQQIYSSDDITSSYSGFWVTLTPQGEVNASYGNGLGNGICCRRSKHPNVAVAKDTWIHVVASFNGLNAIDVYIDGLKQTGTYSGNATNVGYSTTMGSMARYITANNGTRYLNALIDDVRIYNDTLDQNDVNYLTYDVPCTGVVYDSVNVFDTITYSQVVYDSIPYYDSVSVSIQLTQYDTIAIANTLLINSSISISEHLESFFKIYPNPSQDYIYVDLGEEALNLKGKKIIVYSATGAKVLEVPLAHQKTKIETNSLNGMGTYFIQLMNEKGQELLTRKIIVY